MKGRFLGAALAALTAVACSDGHVGPPPVTCVAGGTDGTPLTLAPGGVQVLSGSQTLGCLQIAPTASATEYIFIPSNADSVTDQVGSFLVSSSSAAAASATVTTATKAAPLSQSAATWAGASPELLAAAGYTQVAIESRLRAAERATLASLGAPQPVTPGQSPRLGAGALGTVTAATLASAPCSGLPAVGTICTFKVPLADSSNLCRSYRTVVTQVKAIGVRSLIAEDTTTPQLGNFTSTDYAAIANEFDNLIYAADVDYFGSPSDIDANSRLWILYTPEVNKLTPRGSTGKFGGFFFGGDLFPTNQCAESNQAEIFYLLAPDSLGRYSDARRASEVRQETRGTIAHEFQHMINQSVRMATNAPFEETWLNEALSHLAEELVGRREKGFSDTGNLTFAQVADVATNYNDFNAFFYQNFARFRFWQVRPDTSSATSARADKELAYRGAAWSLVRYTVDQYDGGNVPPFTRALVAGPEVSVANLVRRAGAPFDSLMAGWMVSNYTDDAGIAGLPAKYSYTSWNVRDVSQNLNRILYGRNAYPLDVKRIDSASVAISPRSATGGYFRLSSAGALPATGVSVTARNGQPATFTGARVYVVRAQ